MSSDTSFFAYLVEDTYGDIATDFVFFEEVPYEIPNDAKAAMRNTILFPDSTLVRVRITKDDVIKACNACGLFLPKSRWMNMTSFNFKEGYRPVCDRCEEVEY